MMMVVLFLVLFSVVIGDAATASLSIPVPGSIVGLFAAAAMFALRGGPTDATHKMFDTLIPYAPMLFVPSAAGIVAKIDLISANWLPLLTVITIGTAVALIITGLAAQLLLQWMARSEETS